MVTRRGHKMARHPNTTIVTLLDTRDCYNWRVGMPVVMRFSNEGELVRLTRFELALHRIQLACKRATRWFRPRTVCAAVDVECGTVTMVTETWSWLRWRWM